MTVSALRLSSLISIVDQSHAWTNLTAVLIRGSTYMLKAKTTLSPVLPYHTCSPILTRSVLCEKKNTHCEIFREFLHRTEGQ